jgi:hypothetical protein
LTETDLNLLRLLKFCDLLNFVRFRGGGVLRHNRRRLLLLHLQHRDLFAINPLNQFQVILLQLLISANVHTGHQDFVYRFVEIRTRRVALAIFEIQLALFEEGFGPLDYRIDARFCLLNFVGNFPGRRSA